ncbi:g695 [Coccomyxa viridis]|uniref:G695 protein n=1 Tax=Coccomyxa viridis TaxID=1274662 RepID=A0ABP1FKA3_9CHLO
MHGTALRSARPTVGCNTFVTTIGASEDAAGLGSSSQRLTFVELWDIGSHERYKALRSSFYVDVGGVIIVTDGAESKKRQATVRKWAAEVASRARFASALPPEEAAANPGSLPVPCLVINNKADLRGRQGAWRRNLLTWFSTFLQQFKFRRRLGALMRPASGSMMPDERSCVTTVAASATQGSLDTAAVSSFFTECASLRFAAGSSAGARSAGRRMAVQGAYSGAQQHKPPLGHSPGLTSGPSPPSASPYTSPQMENGGPVSTSSWGGFSAPSRTTSFHSTLSSVGDFGHAWEQAPRHRPAVEELGDAGDDSADLV